MKLERLIKACGAVVLAGDDAGDIDIDSVFAGDKVSDLLNAATPATLIVTNLNGLQLIRLAELMDVPAICVLNNTPPDETAIRTARQQGTTLILSPSGMFETCGQFHRCFHPDGE